MKKRILTLLLSLSVFFVEGQIKKEKDYFVIYKDTTFCQNLEFYTSSQGFLNEIEYTDLNGTVVHIKGRKNVPEVLTFYTNGTMIDKTPLKASKPDGYIRYTERRVNGKLIVYLEEPELVRVRDGNFSMNPNHLYSNGANYGHSGKYRFIIRFPDGRFYKANSAGNMKKYIKPYLLQCPDFATNYKKKYSTKEIPFIEMIAFYNYYCGDK